MRNRFKIILGIIVLLILFFVILLISLNFQNNNDNKKEYKTVDKIEGYDYSLKNRDTELYQEVFRELKNALETDEINYEKYAEYLSELFIIDLFTLKNKDNKYDVGSLQFVYAEVLENYRLNVEDTLYKYIIDINSEDRQNNLPVVESISLDSLESITYNYGKTTFDAYKANLSWDYEEELNYPTKGEVIMIKVQNKLSVVSYRGVEVE